MVNLLLYRRTKVDCLVQEGAHFRVRNVRTEIGASIPVFRSLAETNQGFPSLKEICNRQRFGMINSRSMSTRMIVNLRKMNDSDSGSNLMMLTMYRLRIGSLMYLTHTSWQ
jgi:hypothetical protein